MYRVKVSNLTLEEAKEKGLERYITSEPGAERVEITIDISENMYYLLGFTLNPKRPMTLERL